MDIKSFALGYNARASKGGGNVSQAELEAAIKEVVPEWALEDEPPKDAVTSVNGQTGAVTLAIPSEASDVRADPEGTAESKNAALREEVNGKLVEYEKSTTVDNKISSHNTSTESHADLRLELQRLADRLNAALNSDDTSLDDLKEIVAYIKSNKTLIDGITSSKVNVTDIVNNLTTNTANVPLSAAQGVALKTLIDSLEEIVEGKVTAEQVAAQISAALSGYPTNADMGTAIGNATQNLAPKSSIPTKVSQLSNDSGYLTPGAGDARYAKPSDIPTVPQTLPNPYALTILGKTYTGGKAVSLTAEELMEAIKTASGGVVAYLDGNKLVLSGNLPDATYTAYFVVNGELVKIGDMTLGSVTPDPVTYTIEWRNYDGTVLEIDEKVPEGVTPEYKGETPTKPADSQYTYTFKGWDKTVVAAVADATYTATYTQTAIEVEPAEPTNFFDTSGDGYLKPGRLSSGGANRTDAAICLISNYIPVQKGDIVSVNGCYIAPTTAGTDTHYTSCYNSSKVHISSAHNKTSNSDITFDTITLTSAQITVTGSAVAYLRFTCSNQTTSGAQSLPDTSKIVINIKRGGAYL